MIESRQLIKTNSKMICFAIVSVILGGFISILSVAIPALLIVVTIALTLCSLLVFRFPQFGIAVASLGGRFNIPLLGEMDAPIYMAGGVLVLCVWVLFLKKEIFKIKNKIYFFNCLWFFVILLIGLSYPSSSRYGIDKSIEYGVYTMSLVGLILTSMQSRKNYWYFLYSIVVLTLGLAVIALGASLLNGGLAEGRLAALGGGPNVFGRFMIIGAVSTLMIMSKKDFQWSFLVGSIAIFLFSISTYLTGSRQAIIGFLISIFIYLFIVLINGNQAQRFRIIYTFLAFLVFLLLILTILPQELLMETKAWNRLSLLLSEEKGDSITSRLDMIQFSWNFFLHNWLTGWGTGSFETLYMVHYYPHNIFLEVLVELGILGVIPFLLILSISLGTSIYLVLRNRDLEYDSDIHLLAGLTTCFIFALYTAQISGDLYDNRWIWLFGAMLAGLPNTLIKQKTVSRSPL